MQLIKSFLKFTLKFFLFTYVIGLLAIVYVGLGAYYNATGEYVTVQMHRDEYNRYQADLTARAKARAEAEAFERTRLAREGVVMK